MNKYLLIVLVAGMFAALSPGLFARGSDGRTDEVPSEVNQKNAGDTGEGVCPEGFRFFDHELLAVDPVCVPENPRRVAYLPYPSHMYPFDVNLVASNSLEWDSSNYPFIEDWTGTMADLGLPPNLEVLLGLEPDLILSHFDEVAEVVDELSAIAPLAAVDLVRSESWRNRHLFNGAALGRLELAEAQIAAYEERAVQLRGALEARGVDVAGTTVSIGMLRKNGEVFLFGPWFTGVLVLREVGFKLLDAVDLTLEGMKEAHGNIYIARFSQERLDAVDADILFMESVTREEIDQLKEDPLWGTLGAVRSDSVYPVGGHWVQSNLLTAHMVIDELAEMFGVEMDTSNPFL